MIGWLALLVFVFFMMSLFILSVWWVTSKYRQFLILKPELNNETKGAKFFNEPWWLWAVCYCAVLLFFVVAACTANSNYLMLIAVILMAQMYILTALFLDAALCYHYKCQDILRRHM